MTIRALLAALPSVIPCRRLAGTGQALRASLSMVCADSRLAGLSLATLSPNPANTSESITSSTKKATRYVKTHICTPLKIEAEIKSRRRPACSIVSFKDAKRRWKLKRAVGSV